MIFLHTRYCSTSQLVIPKLTMPSAEEQSRQENIDSLVEHTEQVLESELDGWGQQMQNALAELRKDQGPTTEKEEKRETQEPVLPPKSE